MRARSTCVLPALLSQILSQLLAILVQPVFFFINVVSFVLNRIPILVDLRLVGCGILWIVSHIVPERLDVLTILLNRLLILANVMTILMDFMTILGDLPLAIRIRM